MAGTKKSSNNLVVDILSFPFMLVFIILKSFLNGTKFLTFDLAKIGLDNLSFSAEKTLKKAQYKSTDEVEIAKKEDKKQIKESKIRYSSKYLSKLEAEQKQLIEDLKVSGQVRNEEAVMYEVTVRDKEGKFSTEYIAGFSKSDVNAFLVNEGFEVFSIKTNKFINLIHGKSNINKRQMKVKDLLFWLTQLSTYLKAGIPLTQSVRILGEQLGRKNKQRKRDFQSIVYHLMLGEDFSVALEKQGKLFPGLLINMIKAAEASGTLEETLDDMADYYTEIDKTRKQMISAITYPAIISIFAIGVVIFILVYVIPQFTDIYKQSDVKITGLTSFIIKTSTFLKTNYLYILLFIFAFIIIFSFAYKKIKAFKIYVQKALMHMPVVKNLIIYNEMTIFTKTFASLLKNNVFITDSMDILVKITNNEIYKDIIYQTIDNISKGESISESFKNHWAIPEVAYHMIVTGESTGELAQMMQKVSEYYQEQHRNLVTNLKNFIEPVLIVTLAVVVGGIILAVMGPMFGLYDTIK